MIARHLPDRYSDNWDATGFVSELALTVPLPPQLADEEKVLQLKREEIGEILENHAEDVYREKESELGAEQMRDLERSLVLSAVDHYWRNHLTEMENLRTGVGLHAYGQRDPLVVYRTQGYRAFEQLLNTIGGNPLVELREGVTVPIFCIPIQCFPSQNALQYGIGPPPSRARQGQSHAAGRRTEDRPQRQVPLRQRQEVQALLRGQLLTLGRAGSVVEATSFGSARRGAMNLAVRIVIHVVLFLVAVVIFYLGLGIGLAFNPAYGTLLWFLSGALFVGNLLWLILFLNKRRESAQG